MHHGVWEHWFHEGHLGEHRPLRPPSRAGDPNPVPRVAASTGNAAELPQGSRVRAAQIVFIFRGSLGE